MLAATPIGDPADASPRLRAELAGADVIAAEDTRRLRRLLDRLDVVAGGRIVSYFEGNEAARTPELLTALAEGARVVVVSDAACRRSPIPAIGWSPRRSSRGCGDGGARSVGRADRAGGVGPPGGPLLLRGLPAPQGGERTRRLTDLAAEPRTMVFFEAPHRTADTPRGDG